jgi:hypothetical protein
VLLLVVALSVVHHALLPSPLLQETIAVPSLHKHVLVLLLTMQVPMVLLCFPSATCSMQQSRPHSCQLHPSEARQTQSCAPSSH